jgi:beta-lactamase superfamily II metal-dependent hydrolase
MPYEIDFLPVGNSNGDAICLRYGPTGGPYTIHVVDGGYVDTGDAIVQHLREFYGNPSHIDHVVLTHADKDHAGGLAAVLENYTIGCLWMNRPWLYAEEQIDRFHGNYTVQGLQKRIREMNPHLANLEEIATRRGFMIRDAFAGNQIGEFRVLAPRMETYIDLLPDFSRTPDAKPLEQKGLLGALQKVVEGVKSWFESWDDEKLSDYPPETTASNESSIVQMGLIDGDRLVLTADSGPKALSEAADTAEILNIAGRPLFFQIPHHGSRRNVTPTVLNRWLGPKLPMGSAVVGAAFCSVGTNKPEYPRKRVKNAFLRRGYGVFSCRDGWISYHKNMPARAGMQSIYSEPFENTYEE